MGKTGASASGPMGWPSGPSGGGGGFGRSAARLYHWRGISSALSRIFGSRIRGAPPKNINRDDIVGGAVLISSYYCTRSGDLSRAPIRCGGCPRPSLSLSLFRIRFRFRIRYPFPFPFRIRFRVPFPFPFPTNDASAAGTAAAAANAAATVIRDSFPHIIGTSFRAYLSAAMSLPRQRMPAASAAPAR